MALAKLFGRGEATGGEGDILPASALAVRTRILDECEQAGVGWLWATDADNRLTYLSPAAIEALGRDADDVLGQPIEDVFEIDQRQADGSGARPLKFQVKSRKTIRDQVVRETGQQGGRAWWSVTGHPMLDGAGEFRGYRGSLEDVTREHERKMADSELAEIDSLTGLANRHAIGRMVERHTANSRVAGRSCALMMLDLDKFKRVNDTLGHQAGDDLLKQVAERLTNVVGKRGTVARLGGDEFQIVLPDIDDRGALGELGEKIIEIVSQPYPLGEKRGVIGTSVGIAIAPFDGDTKEDLERSSDLALYAAKNGGRGQFRFYSRDLKNEEELRQIMIDELRVALEEGQLQLHYQPVVDLASGNVVCLEALLRWDHPERGMVPPGQFIPFAEESDLINFIGEWVLRTACETACSWPDTVRVAVNVSAVQFASPNLVTVVANALAHSGLAPERLELELTESVFLGDSDEVEQRFATLKELGVRLALDDFGTGYSSLSYLRAAPFDKIKVDKSFVDSCTQKNRNSAKIIAAIIGLSNALGMETTVEGVEAFDQLEVVRDKGAKLIQGYIFSRPLPEAETQANLSSGQFRIEPAGPDIYRPNRRAMYRRVGAIHEDYYYNAVMRDLSETGAGLEGIVGLEEGVQLVLDLGEGQLAVGTVVRARNSEFSIEFESPMVNDGAGGLCTRHRVSRYMIASAGLPKKPGTAGPTEGKRDQSKPQFMEVAQGGA